MTKDLTRLPFLLGTKEETIRYFYGDEESMMESDVYMDLDRLSKRVDNLQKKVIDNYRHRRQMRKTLSWGERIELSMIKWMLIFFNNDMAFMRNTLDKHLEVATRQGRITMRECWEEFLVDHRTVIELLTKELD